MEMRIFRGFFRRIGAETFCDIAPSIVKNEGLGGLSVSFCQVSFPIFLGVVKETVVGELVRVILRDLCITPHLQRHFRDSGLVMCASTLPSPSLSVPCIWGILQSPCRKSGAFSAKDHFAKVFLRIVALPGNLSVIGGL